METVFRYSAYAISVIQPFFVVVFAEARPGRPVSSAYVRGSRPILLVLLSTALMAWSNWTTIGKPTRSITYKTIYCIFNSLLFAPPHIENRICVA